MRRAVLAIVGLFEHVFYVAFYNPVARVNTKTDLLFSPLTEFFKRVFNKRWACYLLVAFFALPHLPCIFYEDWYVDELYAVVRNADARGDDTMYMLWVNDFWGKSIVSKHTHKSYRPLTVLSYRIAIQLFGLSAFHLRLVSCFIHLAVSLLTYKLFDKLIPKSSGRGAALLGACVMAAHPIHVENVVYLVGRADVMATLAQLVASLLYLNLVRRQHLDKDGNSKTRRFIRVMCFATLLTIAGGLSKESGFFIPMVLGSFEFVYPYLNAKRMATLIVIFSSIAYARYWLVSGTAVGFSYIDTPFQYIKDPLSRRLSFAYLTGYYGLLLFLPLHQSWDYSFDTLPLVSDFEDLRLALPLATYLMWFGVVAWGVAAMSPGRFRMGECPLHEPSAIEEEEVEETTKNSNVDKKSSGDIDSPSKIRREGSFVQRIKEKLPIKNNDNSSPGFLQKSGAAPQWIADAGKWVRLELDEKAAKSNNYIKFKSRKVFGSHTGAAHGRAALMAAAMVIIPFIPASNWLFYVGTVIGERLLYPVSLGWAFLFSVVAWRRSTCAKYLWCMALFYLTLCWKRNYEWSDRNILLKIDLQNHPRSVKAWHQYATVLQKEGKLQEALEHYENSLKIRDDSALTDFCMAQIYIQQGKWMEAYYKFEKIIEKGNGNGFTAFSRFMILTDYGYVLTVLGDNE
eukprot:gene579-102_t